MNPLFDLILLLAALALFLVLGMFSRGPARIVGGRSNGSGTNGNGNGNGNGRLAAPANWYNRLIRQAGLNPDAVAISYWGSKFFLAAVLPLLLGLATEWTYLWSDPLMVLVALIGFLIPDLWLLRVRAVRRRRIRGSMSFFLDLVVSMLHSGLSLERAFLRAARDGFSEPHPLAEEARIIGWEMDMGKDRSAAFETLADRTGVYELRAVSAALSMGVRRGGAIDDALSAQADTMRDRHRERALRRISRASVMAAVPVLLCGLPVFAVVVYFPGFVLLLETIRSLKFF